MKINTLPIEVYRTPRFCDCTNNGISSRYDTLYMACPDGFHEVDSENLPENFVMLVNRHVFGNTIVPTIYPAEINENGDIVKRRGKWYMFGGNYAAASDSRFSDMTNGFYGAVAIHDRCEA